MSGYSLPPPSLDAPQSACCSSIHAGGAAAIARDVDGRLAVLVPHGNQFVARYLDSAASIEAGGGQLVIAELPGVTIALGDRAEDWATTDIDANSA